MTGYFVGIDVGGTFTDVCVAGGTGQMSVHKTPSTPDVVSGVLDGIRLAAEASGLSVPDFLKQVERFGHGSTVAVNALLQRRGVRTGLITTRGFADTLWIARMMAMTTGLPSEQWTHYRRRQRPDPLIDRRLVREVEERVDYRGQVIAAMRRESAERAIEELLAEGIESLAVCTLWSFRNPVHEQAIRQIAQEMAPELYISISSELVPVLKEYERMATTVANSYLGPVVHGYIDGMGQQLRRSGFERDFFMLNSVGGVIPPAEAALKSVQLLGSGPSGGVLAAQQLAAHLGHRNVITADTGGTSFDVGVIVAGEPLLVTEAAVGNLNLLNPMIDIRSIGAGGGSIASAGDSALRVGPDSAGSQPGPACYGRGGARPTVTDADLVLGILNANYFLGGRMRLDARAAEEAIRRHVAEPLGLTVIEAAAGIREVVDQQMADLLRQSTLERGYDPRDFVLFAYGGAGPAHACAFSLAAGIRSAIIPRAATVFSAQGILRADMRISRQRSVLQRGGGAGKQRWTGLNPGELDRIFDELEIEARRAFAQYAAHGGGELSAQRSANMRYARQVHEVPVTVGDWLREDGAAERLIQEFDRVYEGRYGLGSAAQNAAVEVTTCLLQLTHVLPKATVSVPSPPGPLRPSGQRRLYLDSWIEVPVYDSEELPLGSSFDGPAIIDSPGTTVLVGPRHMARVDDLGNLLLEVRS